MASDLPQVKDLLDWYQLNGRSFPWRTQGNQVADPYHVWLSEMMLQQTTTTTVIPYFQHFLEKWPHLKDLAATDLDNVLHAWQGLGYYARARNLHTCAKRICDEYQGQFPQEEKQLLTLPGIGPYTAAAIAAIAFNQRATPIDGNIIRVISRLFGIETPYPKSLPEIKHYAEHLTPKRAGDFAQALMDLGAIICTPKNPKCLLCPWQKACVAFKEDKTSDLPRRLPKKPLSVRYGIVFWLMDSDGRVMLNRRQEKGLLGGMIEFPSTPWREEKWSFTEALSFAPTETVWMPLEVIVRHTFTHFHLELMILKAINSKETGEILQDHPANFAKYALPTVMKKVAKAAKG